MKCYKLITQKEWLALQKKAPESLLAQYGFYEFPKTQLQASGYNTVRYDYSAAQDEAIAHCVQHPEQCQQLYPTLENLGLYYGNNHYGHDNAKVTQALTEALTTGRALLIEKPLTLDCGLLPPQTNFLRLPSNKAPRKLTPAEIRERELFFFDEDNWIEFSVENLPNQSFTLFNSSNQRMIYQGQLDSRGHAYVNLEPDIKLVDVIFDRQTQHRAWYQDVPLQILGGLRDAGQSTLDLLWDSTLINPVSPLFFARVHAEIISDKPIGQAPNPIQMPEVSPPQTISGGITHGVSQFIVGFIPAVRATKFIKPLKNVGSWLKGMIAGSVTDFTVFSPHEERLSNLVQEFPELANPITEYLQAKPDDSFAEGRLKNSLEGLLVGGLAEPLTRSLRLLKYARIKITGTEVRTKVHHKIEAVEVELDEVNWNNVLNEIKDLKELSRYSGDLIKVNKPDAAADALAIRLNGVSRVRFANDTREFDVISDLYIAQTKPPLKQLNQSVRSQMKATFEAAKETNRSVYYHFEGEPAKSVINKLYEYSNRYDVKVIIDTKPLN
ncbi:restriction endonuclease fold toxin [Gilliamella sp. wkB308]|uniref:restriction endonuclease fold toxin n=1 Tax=Gilliamella sp. wkB308 TaxID=3120263 RepID=UPI00080E5B71|nr:restriction endonuclease fold toxin [Gilliamella apicola]OCG00675.1 hypothetical protein A9G10_04210 [Gilliamella apicola]